MTVHFGYRATYGSWPSKEYGCQTDVQEILLSYKESRQLRGEQRVNRGHGPVTGLTSGGNPCRVEGRLNIKRAHLTYPLPHLSREGTEGA